jgi:predicted DNA-binding ribbon-helix-helix protein
MTSTVSKRSIVIGGHKTSVSLEEPFWTALKEIANRRGATLSELVTALNAGRQNGNLSSAIRLFVLGVYQNETSSGSDSEKAHNGGDIAA